MRQKLAITALLALAIGVGAGSARGEIFQEEGVRISFDGGFTPRALPREQPAPVTIKFESSISTSDGEQPPPLQSLEIALNSQGLLSTRGLPVCTSAALQSTTTKSALARCHGALVGHGSFGAALDSTQARIPAAGKILVFNGRQDGKPALFLHLYGTVPVRATFVLALTIEHRSKGQLGTVLTTKIPVLAGGLGSITELGLTIGRRYEFDGRRRSFLSASCAAPEGLGAGIFTFARGSFGFADGTRIDANLTRDCKVR
jgi:hypothetical protein